MNNVDIIATSEFRRFVNTYIYPETIGMLMEEIRDQLDTSMISFEQAKPMPVIKFTISKNIDQVIVIGCINNIFINHFKNMTIDTLIKSRIHTEIQNEKLKNLLRLMLEEIQYNGFNYMKMIFNITMINNNTFYVYL